MKQESIYLGAELSALKVADQSRSDNLVLGAVLGWNANDILSVEARGKRSLWSQGDNGTVDIPYSVAVQAHAGFDLYERVRPYIIVGVHRTELDADGGDSSVLSTTLSGAGISYRYSKNYSGAIEFINYNNNASDLSGISLVINRAL